MESILNLFCSSFIAFVSIDYFQALSGKIRINKNKIWKIYFGLILALSLAFTIDKYGIRLLVVLAIIFTLSHFYKLSKGARFFFTFLFVIGCSLVSALSVTIIYFISEFIFPFIVNYSSVLAVVTFSVLIYGFVSFIKLRGIKASKSDIFDSIFSILPLTPVILLIVLQRISVAFSNDVSGEIGVAGALILLIILATLLLINILILLVIDYRTAFNVEKNVKDKAYQNLNMQRKYYKELLEQHRRSHKEVHDLKNKIQVVTLAVKLNKKDFALKKLEELAGDTFSTRNFSSTGNDVIDAIFGSKSHKLSVNEIDLHLDVDISVDINMNDFDLAAIIGNSIDNAIEACIKLPVDERYIEAEIVEENNTLSFVFTNPTSENLVLVRNSVQTSKVKNKYLHGFGLENIREIARKYDGDSSVKCENGFFELRLNLRIPPL